MDQTVQDLLTVVSDQQTLLSNMMDDVEFLKKNIQNIQRLIHKSCKHEFVRDYTESHDSLTRNRCIHCGLPPIFL